MNAKNQETIEQTSVNKEEISNFASLADKWWEPKGSFQALHAINVPRVTYIRDELCTFYMRDPIEPKPLKDLNILDVGCGGGIIAEPLARLGATVKGIDAGLKAIEVARRHAKESNLDIDYRHTTVENLASEEDQFDCVLSLEVIEHVENLEFFLETCAQLVKPGGIIFLATINRTVASYLFAIIAAERILRWLPSGVHNWSKFVKPSELVKILRPCGVNIHNIKGLSYEPLSGKWAVSNKLSVNYIACGEKLVKNISNK